MAAGCGELLDLRTDRYRERNAGHLAHALREL